MVKKEVNMESSWKVMVDVYIFNLVKIIKVLLGMSWILYILLNK